MDVSEFKAKKAGRVVTCAEGYAAFVPAPLPPRLAFTRELAVALSRADAALGALSGLADALPNPAAMAAPFLRQEALCSSRIEGTDMGLAELLLREASAAPAGPRAVQVDRVWNALATLVYGVECVATQPLDLALIRSLHERLLRGELVSAGTPGEFRTTQNWIGPPGATPAAATYVPPPVPEMLAGLGQLERFMAERGRLPDLVQAAMVHAQFESLHPFVGGNGRLGRTLIVLFLIARGRLSQPLLYLSAYLEAYRREYYALLQHVRTHGEWVPWLLFFADGVRETAERAYTQTRTLLHQRGRYRSQVDQGLLPLVDELLATPFVTVREVRRALSVNDGPARRAVSGLVERGLLARVEGTERPRIYVAQPILDAIEEPIEALVGETDEAPEGEPLKSWHGSDRRPRRLADRLMREAMAMIDAAYRAGVDVRLAGGLAIRRHCIDLEFMDREYSDVDLVGLSGQRDALRQVLGDLGYVENRYVSQATAGMQLQFLRGDALAPASTAAHPLVHHVDVFLDVMRMDHDVDIRARLDVDEYAISPVDALIAKAQIGRINQKDVHDIIALFKDLPLREVDDGLSIYVPYLAEVCAADWGLYTDITTNLRVVLDWLGDYGLSEEEYARVYARVTAAHEAIEDEEKTTRWNLRARVGKRRAWRREIEGAEGTPIEVSPE